MLPAACCALLSVHRNKRGVGPQLVIVGIGLTGDEKAAVGNFCQCHQLVISVIDFHGVSKLPASQGRWQKSTLARLYLDELADPSLDRVLYLDADILALSRVDELLEIDLHGKAIGAVEDYISAFPDKLARRRSDLGLPNNACYFNAGVILMDMKAVRAGAFLATARELMWSGRTFENNDQDILNIAFHDAWRALNHRFNVQTGFMPYVKDPALLHFTGRRKPWQQSIRWLHEPFASMYLDMLRSTRWKCFVSKRGVLRRVSDVFLSIGAALESLHRVGKIKGFLATGRRLPHE